MSNGLKHDKKAVIVLLDELLSKIEHADVLKVWSDGPNSQFKNRYVMEALKLLCVRHNIDIKWNFSATSHGKGPVDGVGTAVKREAWNKIRNRICIVNNLVGSLWDLFQI